MPFIIVSTRRRGKFELCAVPDLWEKDFKLRWPKRNGDLLSKDENIIPQSDWATYSCVVKRRDFRTYEEADEELSRMLEKTDTDDTDNGERSHINTSSSQIKDFNSMAQVLLSSGNSSSVPQPSNQVIQAQGADDGQFYTVVAEQSSQEIVEPSTSQVQHVNDHYITQFDNNIYEILIAIMQNQEKIMKRLAEISVQLDEKKENRTPFVTTLSQAKGFQTKKIIIEPINTVEDLEKLDKELSNPDIYNNLQEKYSILCSVVSGSGTNCAYRLLDALFTKGFLCKCSWTGGSRGADVKIGFKRYKNILKFFFEMVYSWDCTYTIQSNEEFFKTVLRNALKRKDSKNIRSSSTKKKRTLKTRKGNDNKENTNNDGKRNTQTDGEENTNNVNKEHTNNGGEENTNNEEEEDESLC